MSPDPAEFSSEHLLLPLNAQICSLVNGVFPLLRYEFIEGRNFRVFCPLLYTQALEWCWHTVGTQ